MFLLKYIAWDETIIKKKKIDFKNFGNFEKFCLQNYFNKLVLLRFGLALGICIIEVLFMRAITLLV